MEFNEILLKHSDGISTIILNRPDILNVFTFDLLRELKQALEYCASSVDTKVIILTGAGRVFCAGGDIKTMAAEMDTGTTLEFIEASADMIRLIRNMEKPVIAAVNGLAVGAGFNYVLATDLVIASEKAAFMQGFSKLGMIPDAGGIYLLPRIVGLHKAKQLFYMNQLIDAHTAEQIGFVNWVVNDDELEEQALQVARQLVKGPARALGLGKLLLNRSLDSPLDSALAAEAYAQVVLMKTADHKEGVQAFVEKREPCFLGD